ncbi:hypothetical protein ACTWQB_15685 [Piscibacillus sp. B03]|uniref:hypothetical protein n=1 Tax=Piscibacillus sp. B03 TaxID=3457430 RepID=UPI003FCE74EA
MNNNKQNQFDDLNYQKPNRTPVDDFAEWYEKNGKTAKSKNTDEYKQLKERYEKDPNSLNNTELMTLGQYQLDEQRNKDSKDKQRQADKDKQELEKQRQEDEEMIRMSEEQYKVFEQMERLSKAFQELNNIEK